MGLIDSEEEEGVLSTAARAGIVEVCFLLAQPEVEGGRRTPRHPATATVSIPLVILCRGSKVDYRAVRPQEVSRGAFCM